MITTLLDLRDVYFHQDYLNLFGKTRTKCMRLRQCPLTHKNVSTMPLVFTRIVQVMVAHLHSQSIFIHS